MRGRGQGTLVVATGAAGREMVDAVRPRPRPRDLTPSPPSRPAVKLWSLDDQAYVDTLFGHQAEVLGIDAGRQERAVTVGADRTSRLWKIPEESQLIFRRGEGGG